MAQTIKIKRSTSAAAPTTLENAELAYSANSNKLFIGRPGGSTSDVDAIGGKYFTDKLNTIDDNANAYVLPVATATALGGIKLGSNTEQTRAPNAVSSTALRSYAIQLNSLDKAVVNVPWTDVSGNNKLPLAGGTLTGSLVGTNASFASSPAINNTSINIGYDSGNGEIKVKNTGSDGANLDFYTTNDSGLTGLKLRILSGGGLSIGTGTVSMDGALQGCNNLQLGGPITGATTIAASSSVTAPSFLGNATTASTVGSLSGHTTNDLAEATTSGANNLYFTDARVDTRADYLLNHSGHSNISVADGTGANTGKLILTAASQYSDSDAVSAVNGMGITSSGSVGDEIIDFPQFTFSGSTIYAAEVLTLDPSGYDDKTGTVRIRGDLQVDGDTITIDSETVNIADNEIVLNSDLTGVAVDGGIKLNRGSSGADAYLNWSETAGAWQVQGNTITHANSTLDGGSF
jgi:hypothetical protein